MEKEISSATEDDQIKFDVNSFFAAFCLIAAIGTLLILAGPFEKITVINNSYGGNILQASYISGYQICFAGLSYASDISFKLMVVGIGAQMVFSIILITLSILFICDKISDKYVRLCCLLFFLSGVLCFAGGMGFQQINDYFTVGAGYGIIIDFVIAIFLGLYSISPILWKYFKPNEEK